MSPAEYGYPMAPIIQNPPPPLVSAQKTSLNNNDYLTALYPEQPGSADSRTLGNINPEEWVNVFFSNSS